MPSSKQEKNNSQTVRNASKIGGNRINDDWQYLEEQPLPAHPTTDQSFNLSYKEKGLGARKISRKEPEENSYIQINNLQNYRAELENKQFINNDNLRSRVKNKINQLEENEILSKGLDKAHKTKTLAVNRSITYWASYLWVYVQLPFAIFGAILFGVMGGLSSLGKSISEDNFLFKIVGKIVEKSADFLKNIIGFGLDDIAGAFYFITYMVVLAIGLITLLSAFIQHTLALNHPLSGRGAGFKIGAFLLALIGYSIPLLNLFPWVLIWLFAISKYPR
jgi:hypothetical protein